MKTTCHQCSGSGKIFLRNGKFIECDMCEGSGQYIGNLLWVIQGFKIKDFRMNKAGMTLREFAKHCDIDASNLSKMERGIMKPDWTILKLIFK